MAETNIENFGKELEALLNKYALTMDAVGVDGSEGIVVVEELDGDKEWSLMVSSAGVYLSEYSEYKEVIEEA